MAIVEGSIAIPGTYLIHFDLHGCPKAVEKVSTNNDGIRRSIYNVSERTYFHGDVQTA